jgi:hypothetical protein
MGSSDFLVSLALSVPQSQEGAVPLGGSQTGYKRLRIGGGDSGQAEVIEKILGPGTVVRAFWHIRSSLSRKNNIPDSIYFYPFSAIPSVEQILTIDSINVFDLRHQV